MQKTCSILMSVTKVQSATYFLDFIECKGHFQGQLLTPPWVVFKSCFIGAKSFFDQDL